MVPPLDLKRSSGVDDVSWDGVVIGAGPAGALAARQLALAGRRVLLVEKKRFPRWKICGACLNARALDCLSSVGLGDLVARLGAIELDQLRVGYRHREARVSLPAGASVSRSKLDLALVEAAVTAGAVFRPETEATVGDAVGGRRLVRLSRHGETIEVQASVVLIAAGLGNRCLAGSAIGQTRVRSGSRIGAGCSIGEAPDFYEPHAIYMAVGRGGYVGAARVEDGSLNLAAAFDPALVRRHGSPGAAAVAVLEEAGFPAIAGLDRADWRGTVGLTRRTTPLARERLFLIGDAAGYVEPFTGEGMAWALASAQGVSPLADRAIEGWDPSLAREWARLHRRLIGRRQVVCRSVARILRRPWMAAVGFEVLSRLPASATIVVRHLNAPSSFMNASPACPS